MTTASLEYDHNVAALQEHSQVWSLLPWVVNGSASVGERAKVAAHLDTCADCRAELEAQQTLRRALFVQTPAVSLEREAGLKRLLGRLDSPLEVQPLPAPTNNHRRSPLIAAMAAAIMAQAVGLGMLGLRNSGPERDTANSYLTLSQPAAAVSAATLRVVPAPNITMDVWKALLLVEELRVVDGPSEAGAYALAPAAGSSLTMDEQLVRLRQTPAIRLAEPVAPH